MRWRRLADRPAQLRCARVAKHRILPMVGIDPGHKHGPVRVQVAVDAAYQRLQRLRSRVDGSSRRLGQSGRRVGRCSVDLVDGRIRPDETVGVSNVIVGGRFGFAAALASQKDDDDDAGNAEQHDDGAQDPQRWCQY